jgi:hypothetical protein
MREMVLDIVDRAGKRPARHGAQFLGYAGDLLAVAQPAQQQARARPVRHDITKLAEKIGAAVAVDGDMRDVAQIGPGFVQAVADGLSREAGPMLDAAKPFLFGGRHQDAVAQDAGCCIRVVGVDSEYQHIRCRRFA